MEKRDFESPQSHHLIDSDRYPSSTINRSQAESTLLLSHNIPNFFPLWQLDISNWERMGMGI